MALKLTGFAAAGITLAVCFPLASASAGDNNSASLLQSGSNNTLSIDQSNASSSLVGLGTNPLGNSAPLAQYGSGNSASITVNGHPSSLLSDAIGSAFLQQGSLINPVNGNMAVINLNDAGSAGSVTQTGSQNQAFLTASGGAHGAIQQLGSSNLAGLSVSGSPLSVTYIQNGSGLTAGSQAAPVTVTTSGIAGLPGGAAVGGVPITITQTKN